MSNEKVYAVMRIDTKLKLADTEVDCTLPKGCYVIPCFSDYEKAKEVAGDVFEIVEFKRDIDK